jgi:prolipoprotein diacylglyceryltransferase
VFFEALSYFIAALIYLWLRRRFGDSLYAPLRSVAIAAAVAGAALGSRFLFLLEDPALTWHNLNNPAFLLGGKTIVGALIGGLVSVELVKRSIVLHQSTGDLYAIPLAIGIAIGRIGCFLAGLPDNTYGIPTNLPWGVNFGDGIPRHPTQLYEIIFLLALVPFLDVVLNRIVILGFAGSPAGSGHLNTASVGPGRRHFLPGDAFKVFMVAYLSFRLIIDFIKPYPRIFFGFGGIQWACLLILLYYFRDIVRWLNLSRSPA